jgi:hypothetical protein
MMKKNNLMLNRSITIFCLLLTALLITPSVSNAALLYTSSANQVAYVGETFVVQWYLDTQDKSINSLSLTLTYSKEKLEVVESSVGDSSFNLWVKTPEFDNSKGEIKLIGGLSGGVSSNKLPVFRATFKPLATGNAKISLKQDSDVLLADGMGSSAGLIFTEVSFNINPIEAKPAHITSETHPDQDAWYKNKNAVIKVETKEGEQYSYSFSSNIEIIPDDKPDDVSQPLIFNDNADGIYYFKLNSRTGPSNWQEAGVYRVKIDGTPPREFNPAISKDPAVFDGQAFVSFNATDNVSGVSYYEVKSGLFGSWQKTNDPYFKLSGLVLGDKIEVKVVDEAGNERITEVKVDKTIANSVFSNLIISSIIVISLIAVGLLVWLYFKLLKKYKVNDN